MNYYMNLDNCMDTLALDPPPGEYSIDYALALEYWALHTAATTAEKLSALNGILRITTTIKDNEDEEAAEWADYNEDLDNIEEEEYNENATTYTIDPHAPPSNPYPIIDQHQQPHQPALIHDQQPLPITFGERQDDAAQRVQKHMDKQLREEAFERIQYAGVTALSSIELVTILVDDHLIARTLYGAHQTLDNIARASFPELKDIKGLGRNKAAKLKAAFELGRRLLMTSPTDKPQVRSPADAANLLMAEMALLEQEQMRVMLLDTRNRVHSVHTVYQGSLNTTTVRVGELFKHAIKANSAAVIVAHNHPSGDPSPSPEDVAVTRQLVSAGQLLDIEVLDHVIIGQQRYVSLKERGLGFDNT